MKERQYIFAHGHSCFFSWAMGVTKCVMSPKKEQTLIILLADEDSILHYQRSCLLKSFVQKIPLRIKEPSEPKLIIFMLVLQYKVIWTERTFLSFVDINDTHCAIVKAGDRINFPVITHQ